MQRFVQIVNRPRPWRIQRCDSPVLDTSTQFVNNTIQILVRQQPEHRQTLADRWTAGQTPRQILCRMGVVPHIQQQVKTLALPVELPTI
ncbi:hypothetical protein D3C87_1357050 [compost metagenome]